MGDYYKLLLLFYAPLTLLAAEPKHTLLGPFFDTLKASRAHREKTAQCDLSGTNARFTPVVRAIQKTNPAFVSVTWNAGGRTNSGSGMIVNEEGYILTNAHVVHGTAQNTITLMNGTQLPADLVYASFIEDIALLKVNLRERLPKADLGNSSTLVLGEPLIALGDPAGLQRSVTCGVLSGMNRFAETEKGPLVGLLQTDTPINPGNSGGPLMNIYGQVVGINSAYRHDSQSISYAIPIDSAITAAAKGLGLAYQRWHGLVVQNTSGDTAKFGAPVQQVEENSPAARAGLKPGDVLVTVNGTPVHNALEIEVALKDKSAGGTTDITYLRNNQIQSARFSLESYDARISERLSTLGFQGVKPTRSGLVVENVSANSAAQSFGMKSGDIILDLSQHELRSPNDLLTVLEAPPSWYRGKVPMVFLRNKQVYKGNWEWRLR